MPPEHRHGVRRRDAPLARAREPCRRDPQRCDGDAGDAGRRKRPPIERNHVYVIPPGARSASRATATCSSREPRPARGRHVAIDLFFRTLADVHRERAIGVVLSGAGSDGAIGIKRIKERGGLTIAQEPDEAEHDGMPRAAIATGMVDWVLPVAEMPRAARRALAPSTRRVVALPDVGAGPHRVARADGTRRAGRGGAARRAALAAHAHRPRLPPLQARHRAAPHRAAHAGQRRRRRCRLPRLPAHGIRQETGAAAAGHADQRHQLLPRPPRPSRRWSAT